MVFNRLRNEAHNRRSRNSFNFKINLKGVKKWQKREVDLK